ncbi:MAG: hypothetical protein ACO3IG_09600, partial [Opitutales bacterium]
MRPLLILSASLLAFGCKPAPQVARYEVKSDAAQAPAAAPAHRFGARAKVLDEPMRITDFSIQRQANEPRRLIGAVKEFIKSASSEKLL